MQRISYFILLVWLIAAGAWSGTVTPLRLIYVDPAGSPVDVGGRSFKSELEKRSGGTFAVQLSPGGYFKGLALDELQILKKLRDGEVHMAIVTTAPVANYSPPVQVLDTPHLFRDYSHVYRTLDGEVGDGLLNGLLPSGLRGLAWMDSGFRIIASTRPVRTYDEFKGLRIRIMQNEVYYQFCKLNGAIPVPAPVTKINEMAILGYVDSADRSYPTFWEFRNYEVFKYTLESRHAYAAELVLINERFYQKLTPDQQKMIRDAAIVARDAQRQAFRTAETRVKRDCRKRGIELNRLSDADQEAMRKACEPLRKRMMTRFGPLLQSIEAVK